MHVEFEDPHCKLVDAIDCRYAIPCWWSIEFDSKRDSIAWPTVCEIFNFVLSRPIPIKIILNC